MFVSVMAFYAQISDPAMGGTYMTLLNTLTNLGGIWCGTLVLWFVDVLSFKDCVGVADSTLDCDTMKELEVCVLILMIVIFNFIIDVYRCWRTLCHTIRWLLSGDCYLFDLRSHLVFLAT